MVYNASQINSEKKTQLLGILKDFFDLFDGTLGYWYIEPVDLELNTCYKPFDCKYYPVPEINKETFCKELERLVVIGVLTPVLQSQYITPIFIIPKKEVTVRFITDCYRINQKLIRKPHTLHIIADTMQ